MTEQPLLQQEIFVWVLGLVIGLPLLIILLGEVIEQLQERGNPLAQGLRQMRNFVVPLLALFLIVRQVLGMAASEISVRTLETLFWAVIMITLLTLLSNLTRLGEVRPAAWISKVPALFFALGRALVVLVVVYYVLTNLWGVDLSNLITAVGVGSVVIALALQDTLSNLVSGFLLLVDRPFQVGDYVEIEGKGYFLIVEEVNWRAVRFRSYEDWTVEIIPNGVLGTASIKNFGQQGTPYKIRYFIGFSYDDPPNRVKQVLLDVLKQQEGVIQSRTQRVLLWDYEEYSISYCMEFFVHFGYRYDIGDRLKTRIYYAAQRHGLTIPFPIGVEYDLNDLKQMKPAYNLGKMLRAIPLLQSLDQETIDWLVTGAKLSHYGAGERLVQAGIQDEGFYIIHNGGVRLTVEDGSGQEHVIAHLSAGDFFGAMDILHPDEPSRISVTASDDLQVLIIRDDLVIRLIERNPNFALELNYFVDEWKKAVDTILDVGEPEPIRSNGRAGLVSG